MRRHPPLRTCLGCRRTRPQAELLRLVRTPDGRVRPDHARRAGGRGAYVCRREACLLECVRRSRWSQAFRAPAVATREAIEELRGLVNEGREAASLFQGGK